MGCVVGFAEAVLKNVFFCCEWARHCVPLFFGVDTFDLHVFLSLVTDPYGSAADSVRVITNSGPTGGWLNVEPSVGVALETEFMFEASGWSDTVLTLSLEGVPTRVFSSCALLNSEAAYRRKHTQEFIFLPSY